MQELLYVLSIGFSGTDLIRGVGLALFASLFVSSRFSLGRVILVAFLLDQALPFVQMYFMGAGTATVGQSVVASLLSVPENLAYYVVRYAGFMAMIYVCYKLRYLMHARTGENTGKRTAYPY